MGGNWLKIASSVAFPHNPQDEPVNRWRVSRASRPSRPSRRSRRPSEPLVAAARPLTAAPSPRPPPTDYDPRVRIRSAELRHEGNHRFSARTGTSRTIVFGDDAALRYSLLAVTVAGLAGAAALLIAGLAPYRQSVAGRSAWSGAVSASETR